MIDVEALGLEDKVGDVAFLNEIQAGVNKWIKEIQKVTRLVRYVGFLPLGRVGNTQRMLTRSLLALSVASHYRALPCKKSISGAI